MITERLSSGKERDHGLDFLKAIAVCLIVFVHMPFPKPFGVYLAYVGSVGVSIFFMTAGYYAHRASRARLLHALKRTALYLLVADLLYLVKLVVEAHGDVGQVASYLLSEVFTPMHVLKTFVVSQSGICHVAWFLIALFYCYVLKLLLGRYLRVLGYVGLLAGIVVVLPPIADYMDFPLNNHWMWGIPFFVMGDLVCDYESRIRQSLNPPVLVLLCVLGVAISLLARYYGTLWWHIGNMVLAPASFVLLGGNRMKYHRVCLLGGTYAFFIYIVHPLVIAAYLSVSPSPGPVERWLRPLIVLAVTTMLAALFYRCKKRIELGIRDFH